MVDEPTDFWSCIHPERFPSIVLGTHWRNGLTYMARRCSLTTLKTDQILVTVKWFSSFWYHLDLVKLAKFDVSGPFLEKGWKEWPKIWYNVVCWPPPELTRFCARSVDFPKLGTTLTSLYWSNLGFLGIFLKNTWSNGMKFDMKFLFWSISELIIFWSWFVDFPHFGLTLT